MFYRNPIVFAVAAAGLIITPGVFASVNSSGENKPSEAMVSIIVSKAAAADPALAAAADLAVPAEIPTPAGVLAPASSEPPAAAPAARPTVLAVLAPTKIEANGYSLVPAPDRPGEKTADGPSFGKRLSRLCSDYRDRISFDCVESPAIAMLNIAAENERKSPATYWIVGALGMILGAILFLPALAIALVSGGAKLIHDIVAGP